MTIESLSLGNFSLKIANSIFFLFFSPYTILCYIAWLLRWHWKFTICGEEYGDEEKQYIIRKKLGLSSIHWDALDAAEKKVFFSRQLWIDSNFQVS